MRPKSITTFELLFFIGLALGAAGFFMNFDAALAQMQDDPNITALGMGSGTLIGAYIIGVVINLLLWFFIARKPSVVAKWIYIALFGIGLLGLPGIFAGGFGLMNILALAGYAIQAYMVYLLFQPDTRAWLSGDASPGPATFD